MIEGHETPLGKAKEDWKHNGYRRHWGSEAWALGWGALGGATQVHAAKS